MPTSAARRAREIAAASRSAPDRIVRASVRDVDRAVKAEVKTDTGGDSRLSGAGNALLGTRIEFTGRTSIVVADLMPGKRSRGLWAILQKGTQGHDIMPRRRNEKRLLSFRGSVVYGGVTVSGVHGKRTWTNGVKHGTPDAIRTGRNEWSVIVSGK